MLVSEKALSISQGNALPVADIRTTRAARLLSRFVSRTPVGVGLGHPATMQLAIDEVGLPRILLAAVAATVTPPVRDARRLLPRRRWTGERDRRAVVGQPPSLRHLGVQGADRLRRRGAPDRERDRGPHRAQGRRGDHRRQRPRRRGVRHHRRASTRKPCARWSSTTRSASRRSRRRSDWFARLSRSSDVRAAQAVEVDASAIRSNTAAIVGTWADGVQVMAMVKSNGYGHGIRLAAEAAIAGGATWLGVASSTEALDVADLGVPVLIVGRGDPGSHDALVAEGIETTVYDDEGVDTMATAAAPSARPGACT